MFQLDEDGGILPQVNKQFVRNHSKLIFAHHFDGGFIFRQRVVKGDLLIGQMPLLPATARGADVMRRPDQHLQHFGRVESRYVPN